MSASDLYVYRSELVRVIDGDTFDFMIDPGFYLTYAARVRLFDWDTPERFRGSPYERERAYEATEVVKAWMQAHAGWDLYVRTHKADSFGRWLAEVFVVTTNGTGEEREDHLSTHLADRELATQWPDRWRDVYDHTITEESS